MTVDGVLTKNGSTSRCWEADLMQADDLRRLIPATGAGVVTLDRLGEARRDRIIALRTGILLAGLGTS